MSSTHVKTTLGKNFVYFFFFSFSLLVELRERGAGVGIIFISPFPPYYFVLEILGLAVFSGS